jgi:hypothetical protein
MSTSSFPYPGNVGLYNHPLLGPASPLATLMVSPHSWRPSECLLATLMGLYTLPSSQAGHCVWYHLKRLTPNDTILSTFGFPELDLPGGHPSWYNYCISTLNCGVLIGSWSSRLWNALCQEMYKYSYKHILIFIPRRCGTSQSPHFGTERLR